MATQIKLADVRLTGCNARADVNDDAIAEYIERHEGGSPFPSIEVYHELGGEGNDIYWVADGRHRVTAAKRLEHETIPAEILKGGRRESLEHSIKSNHSHGVRRTNADKRLAVELVLADDVWREWSNAKIAQFCCVGDQLVAIVRAENQVRDHEPAQQSVTTKRLGKDGKRQSSKKAPSAGASKLAPTGGISFDVPAIEKPKGRPGKQKRDPKVRKEALKVYGQLVRVLDKLGVTPDVESQLKDILQAIKES